MIIRSSKEFCENYDAFSQMAKEVGEPIFLTKEGNGDLVLMSLQLFEKLTFAKKSLDSQQHPQKETKGEHAMTEFLLGNILKELYLSAPRGLQAASIHVFAINYANVLENERLSKKEILKVAGLPESYITEISKGVRLAQFVTVKPETEQRIRQIESSIA